MGGIYNDLLKDIDIEEKDLNNKNNSRNLELPIKIKETKLYQTKNET
jgi:hypothetical protein